MYIKGIVAGILAGALWGLTFVAPLVAEPYSPFDLTVLRYAVFGLASLVVLMFQGWSGVRGLTLRDTGLLVWLGFSGSVGYYLAVSLAVPRAGAGLVALIIGCLPVILALLGRRGVPGPSLRRLVLPLVLTGLGLAVVNGAALFHARNDHAVANLAAGLALVLLALALWTCYGLTNAQALARRRQINPIQWTALTGVGALLALVPVTLVGLAAGLSKMPEIGLAGPPALRLLIWAIVLGLLSSWAATWAWSVASRSLPVSLAGQLIVCETLSALIYAALYFGKPPGLAVAIGSMLLVAGVVTAVRVFSAEARYGGAQS